MPQAENDELDQLSASEVRNQTHRLRTCIQLKKKSKCSPKKRKEQEEWVWVASLPEHAAMTLVETLSKQ